MTWNGRAVSGISIVREPVKDMSGRRETELKHSPLYQG
jgi:hypothetical protein